MANKLELTWIGKDTPIQPEPRILLEDKSKSYGDANAENLLIHGDNLLALKALESKYAGLIKCIYIDPPYNTGNAFDRYDDNLEHSIWLNLMRPRLEILHRLLSTDGVFFCNLDEKEHAYLKVILDEIFGRENFIGDIIWKKRKGGGNDSFFVALDHDYILTYAKKKSKEVHKQKWRISQSEKYLKRYSEIDEDGDKYYWDTLARDGLQNPIPVTIKCPDGTILSINSQQSQKAVEEGLVNGMIKLTKTKTGWSLHHRVYMPLGQVLRSVLDEAGTNKDAGDEMELLFGDAKVFDYPKPEKLIQTLIELNTSIGDLVLDSFLGSGTTAAVAHKMGRRWIGIEMRDHAYTHCKVRLDKVINGTDGGGITKSVGWTGGGGYKFYEIAPTLIKKDKLGCAIINPEYNADMLAAAVAKHEGFEYVPDNAVFWKQARFENAYLFTTTRHITAEYLSQIADELQDGEYLTIAAKSFEDNVNRLYKNIKVKKIPNMLLNRCEYDKDNYNLKIISVPKAEGEDE